MREGALLATSSDPAQLRDALRTSEDQVPKGCALVSTRQEAQGGRDGDAPACSDHTTPLAAPGTRSPESSGRDTLPGTCCVGRKVLGLLREP